MKFRPILALILIASVSPALAEKPFPKPVTAGDKLTTKSAATSKLPEALKKLLLEQEVFADEPGKLVKELSMGEYDLNGDGVMEILVEDPSSSTGGLITYIFAKNGDAFTLLGSFQAIEYLAAPANGYPQIVTFARAGGGIYVRELWAFKDGAYQSVRGAEYEVDDNDKETYVKEVES